ncbi:uncharacterized protein METZ01_LOCUS321639, partial [marine metagenome]
VARTGGALLEISSTVHNVTFLTLKALENQQNEL